MARTSGISSGSAASGSGNDDIVFLVVCEDDKWTLAERYPVKQTQKAIRAAKLSFRATGVTAVRVVYQFLHPETRALGRVLVFDDVKIAAKVPKPPLFAKPFGEPRELPAIALEDPPEEPAPEPPRAAAAPRPTEAPRRPDPPRAATSPRPAEAPRPGESARAARPAESAKPPEPARPAEPVKPPEPAKPVRPPAAQPKAVDSGPIASAVRQAPAAAVARPVEAVPARASTLSVAAAGASANPNHGDAPAAAAAASSPLVPLLVAAPPFAAGDLAAQASEKSDSGLDKALLDSAAKQLVAFLGQCLTEAAGKGYISGNNLDQRSRFGLHLFVLGAAQARLAAAAAQPSGPALTEISADALLVLGSDRDAARRVIDGVDSYMREAKAAAMIRAGSDAMTAFLAGDAHANTILGEAFKIWNMVDREGVLGDDAGQDVAIMFTDMVSSVETTMEIGEAGMMQLVEQHNLIVGAVLKTHRGHQVKHTGDGVMAMFPRVVDGIAAAAEIQRQIAEYNATTSARPLKVRIGLASGNPIRKDDDYFGTVVQTAARMCPIAGTGEVALPEGMTQLPGCDQYAYSEQMLVPLKGFAAPQAVRKLLWSQSAPSLS